MVTVVPATVSVPVRELPVKFSLTSKLTRPLPLALAAEVSTIHELLLTAVQPHPPGAVTVTVPLPPAIANVRLVGVTVKEQVDCVVADASPE